MNSDDIEITGELFHKSFCRHAVRNSETLLVHTSFKDKDAKVIKTFGDDNTCMTCTAFECTITDFRYPAYTVK